MYTVYVYVGGNVKMKQIQLMHAYAYIGNICLTFNECFVHAVHLGDIYAMFAECAGTFSVSWDSAIILWLDTFGCISHKP